MGSQIDRIRSQLVEDGYAIVERALSSEILEDLRRVADNLWQSASDEHLSTHRTTGSMLPVKDEPAFSRLVGWEPTLSLLRSLQFGDVAWASGYLIVKPGGGPRLFWHQDWLWWTHPESRAAIPHQLFAMYYLTDTTRENGCLRVLPGSHRRRLPAHDKLDQAHSAGALAGDDLEKPMFGDLEGEVDVPVKAGDLLIGDARLLHAAHANLTKDPRALITLWYYPAWDKLPEAIKASVGKYHGDAIEHWPADARAHIPCTLPGLPTGPDWPIERTPHPDRAST